MERMRKMMGESASTLVMLTQLMMREYGSRVVLIAFLICQQISRCLVPRGLLWIESGNHSFW